MDMTSRLVGGLVLCILLPLLAGCGRGWGNVSGKVTYKGQALPKGTITFFDETNQAVSSGIGADGSYAVSKVAAGKVKIAVALPMPIFMAGDKEGAARAAAERKKLPNLPARYADYEKSGLDREVKRGDQTLDLDLTD
jgi:hypothetical protein